MQLITAKEARLLASAPEPKGYAAVIMNYIDGALESNLSEAKAYLPLEEVHSINRGFAQKVTAIDPEVWKEWLETLDYRVSYKKERNPLTAMNAIEGIGFETNKADLSWEFTIKWESEKKEESK